MTATPNGYVTVIWEAKAKTGKEADLKAFITAAVTPSRNDAGNIDYEAHEVDGKPGEFVIYERWETREHLDAHLSAPRMQDSSRGCSSSSTEPSKTASPSFALFAPPTDTGRFQS